MIKERLTPIMKAETLEIIKEISAETGFSYGDIIDALVNMLSHAVIEKICKPYKASEALQLIGG